MTAYNYHKQSLFLNIKESSGMKSNKDLTANDILLAPKVLEQVRIYFFNIAILNNANRYSELISREKLILQIEDEFSEFLEKYKLDPKYELCSFLELDFDTSPVSSEKKAISKFAQKLLVINKGLKKKILAQSKDNLASFWVDELKQTTLNFVKWVSTTIIVVGFIKAFIYAELLDTPLSLLFSVQDYLSYGITSSLVPFFFIISIIMLLTESIFLSEYSNFNYTKRIKDKYDFSDAKETKPIHLFICIFGVILCFIFRHYLPEYYSFYELCLGVILIFFLNNMM